jgi:hypothetical protein
MKLMSRICANLLIPACAEMTSCPWKRASREVGQAATLNQCTDSIHEPTVKLFTRFLQRFSLECVLGARPSWSLFKAGGTLALPEEGSFEGKLLYGNGTIYFLLNEPRRLNFL